jgi:hypothetical protein
VLEFIFFDISRGAVSMGVEFEGLFISLCGYSCEIAESTQDKHVQILISKSRIKWISPREKPPVRADIIYSVM